MSGVEGGNKPKRASGKRSKKRKFTGNVYTRKQNEFENAVLNESASRKKTKYKL